MAPISFDLMRRYIVWYGFALIKYFSDEANSFTRHRLLQALLSPRWPLGFLTLDAFCRRWDDSCFKFEAPGLRQGPAHLQLSAVSTQCHWSRLKRPSFMPHFSCPELIRCPTTLSSDLHLLYLPPLTSCLIYPLISALLDKSVEYYIFIEDIRTN